MTLATDKDCSVYEDLYIKLERVEVKQEDETCAKLDPLLTMDSLQPLHHVETNHACNFCQYWTHSKNSLRMLIRRKHSDKKPQPIKVQDISGDHI